MHKELAHRHISSRAALACCHATDVVPAAYDPKPGLSSAPALPGDESFNAKYPH